MNPTNHSHFVFKLKETAIFLSNNSITSVELQQTVIGFEFHAENLNFVKWGSLKIKAGEILYILRKLPQFQMEQ